MYATWKRYRQASKAAKTRILYEFCDATGYQRKYAIARIGQVEECTKQKPRIRRTQERLYGQGIMNEVEKTWEEAGYQWSVRPKVIFVLWRPWIRKRYTLTSAQESQLLRVDPG